MTGFPWLLLIVGLLAVALCLLREHDYLEVGKFPANLGWWAQMVDTAHTWGFRVQFERYALGDRFMVRFYPPFLDWPATLRIVLFRHVNVAIYLGARRRPEPAKA